MIEIRRAQLSFGDGLIAEEVSDLREERMKQAEGVLADDQIIQIMAVVYRPVDMMLVFSSSRGSGLALLVASPELPSGVSGCRVQSAEPACRPPPG